MNTRLLSVLGIGVVGVGIVTYFSLVGAHRVKIESSSIVFRNGGTELVVPFSKQRCVEVYLGDDFIQTNNQQLSPFEFEQAWSGILRDLRGRVDAVVLIVGIGARDFQKREDYLRANSEGLTVLKVNESSRYSIEYTAL